MAKTIVVQIERRFKHAQFRKTVTRSKSLYAHDDGEKASVGDTVLIRESRPYSKLKRWELVEVLEPAKK
jgi:small subunit ribosomal protein S17